MKGEIHMDDKIKNKEQFLEHEQKTEKSKDEVREISDQRLEDIAGGTTPVIPPF